jgi:hypothetical protein
MSQAVVQAAQQVAQVQNRFQNLGGQVAKGMQIVEAKNQARRQAAKKATDKAIKDAVKYSKTLDNNINYLGFTDEETKILKDESLKYTTRFYEVTNMLNNITDQTTDQAQALVNERNDIKNWFKNVNNQQKTRVKGRDIFNENEKSISSAPQNLSNINDASTVNNQSFTTISPLGEFEWSREDGRVLKLEDGNKYFLNPDELFALTQSHYDKAHAKSLAFSPGQINGLQNEFELALSDKNTFAGFIGDSRLQDIEDAIEGAAPGIIDRFEEAYDSDDAEAYKKVVEEMGGLYRNYLEGLNNDHVAAVQGQKPKPRRKSRFTDAQQGVIDSIVNAQKNPEDAPPITLPGYPGYYKWSTVTQMFVKTNSSGVVEMEGAEPAKKVTLENITEFGRIKGLRVKDITK